MCISSILHIVLSPTLGSIVDTAISVILDLVLKHLAF
jgi:hypothetical protein